MLLGVENKTFILQVITKYCRESECLGVTFASCWLCVRIQESKSAIFSRLKGICICLFLLCSRFVIASKSRDQIFCNKFIFLRSRLLGENCGHCHMPMSISERVGELTVSYGKRAVRGLSSEVLSHLNFLYRMLVCVYPEKNVKVNHLS